MSDQNTKDGRECYLNEPGDTRAWFENQWRLWPARVDEDRTCNISFHYGGILAYREVHKRNPKVSPYLKTHIDMLDEFRK